MSKSNIRESDLQHFFKACEKLNDCIEAIRRYAPDTHLYVTPERIHLVDNWSADWEGDRDAQDNIIAEAHVSFMDCGDW